MFGRAAMLSEGQRKTESRFWATVFASPPAVLRSFTPMYLASAELVMFSSLVEPAWPVTGSTARNHAIQSQVCDCPCTKGLAPVMALALLPARPGIMPLLSLQYIIVV